MTKLKDYEYYRTDLGVLYCGDCLEILPLIDDKVDLVLTDPPYGVGFKYDGYIDDERNFTRVKTVINLITRVYKYEYAIFMSMKNMKIIDNFKWCLCWYKPGSTRRNKVKGFSIWEPIFINGNNWKVANDAIRLPDCVNHDKGNNHPCPKPIKLFEWILKQHDSDLIIDCFLGSGTTAVACEKLGRRWIGIEISEKYCEIAKERIKAESDQFKMEFKK